MPTLWDRLGRTALSVVATSVLATGCQADSAAQAGGGSPPGRQVRLEDGRTLNLRCKGSGSPTVLLEPGFGADGGAWFKVQPDIARLTQVCAYDRAGAGGSDPGPLPRDGAAIARDLDAALRAADLPGPYIVVGHSAGGLYARLFAARRPGDVVGLVFLDPTVERSAPEGSADLDGLGGTRRRLLRCLTAATTEPPPRDDDPQWGGCVARPVTPHAIKVAKRADTWRNQISELDSIFRRTSREVARTRGLLDDIPAYVITASDTAAAAPRIGVQDPQSAWVLQHLNLAAEFRQASQQTVLSSHMVMLDRPDIVTASIRRLVQTVRTGSELTPLDAGEWPVPARYEAPPSIGP